MDLLYVQVVKKAEKEYVIQCISIDKNTWYLVPEEFKDISVHTALSNKKTIKNAMFAIKNQKGYRTVAVKIDEDIQKEYFDEANNVCFRELPLEECVPRSISRVPETEQTELESRIRELENQLNLNLKQDEIKLHQIEKKFVLEKFEKNQSDPKEWLSRFEEECSRFQINSDCGKIQALRFFVSGPAKDWFEINLKKIGINGHWESWKESFLNVFVDKGWDIVRKAFNYKYLGGSLIDYALTKERLCLEVEPRGTELSRINHIVFGLPKEAQEELDRENITALEDLYVELRKLEDSFSRKKKENPSSLRLNQPSGPKPFKRDEFQQKNEIQRKPCSICVALGFPNRYHLLTECRNRNKVSEKLKSNMTKGFSEIDDLEILKIDLGNKNLN